jgi:hypothetical protein
MERSKRSWSVPIRTGPLRRPGVGAKAGAPRLYPAKPLPPDHAAVRTADRKRYKRRSTIIACPMPPATHMVSSP